ncbi:duf887 family protein [Moniliophthora roreri MCA 2997]|uniref:Duf887 family protein n=2 Tax=Moniliophthora roreri TaxID=221103 RepID=V2WXF5_MONRO|nr:duf887 family protein [Moniliophthora roreri MCA 2997]KAI3616577.1 duf887 family protein [Moniliophthora roreri]
MPAAGKDISIEIMNATTSLVPRAVVGPLEKFALRLGLTKLPAHIPTLICSFFLFLFIHQVAAPLISPIVASESWSKLRGRRGRNNWCIHIVSQVHVLVCVPLALRALYLPALDKDRAFGWDDRVGTLTAFSLGYFLWDSLDAIVNFEDPGFVAHGVACSMIYLLAFNPFLAYYAARCLLWETSTIFLNIHWFCDKTNNSGGILQLINGVFLLASFLGVRIIHGSWVSWNFWNTLRDVKDNVPLTFVLVYGVGNILLNGLNWIWFSKMVTALQKRFKQPKAAAAVLSNGVPKKVDKIAKME